MEHVKAALSEYLDRELPEEELREVESHLGACPACRRELEELKALSKLFKELPREPLPVGFMQRLERRRREQESASPSSFLMPAPARALAFALSSIVVVFLVYQQAERMFPAGEGGAPQTTVAPAAQRQGHGEMRSMFSAGALAGASSSMEYVDKAAAKKASLSPAVEAPKPVRSLAGAPMGEAPAAAPRAVYTNKALHQALEAEKTRMGIRKILARSAPQATMTSLGAVAGGSAMAGAGGSVEPLNFEAFKLPAAAPTLQGSTPALLASQNAQRTEDAAAVSPAGIVIRSAEEQSKAWHEKALTGPAPRLDYARQMLVVVVPQEEGDSVEITGIVQSDDRIILQYREAAATPGGPSTSPAYQLRVLPRSDLPVLFQRVP